MFALEALYYTKFMNNDVSPSVTKLKKLNWTAAIKFIERCQNLPETNDQAWASDDPQNKGGFIYFPGDSKAGEMKLASGKTALRSYASISYAGMLSFAYADLKKDDIRVQAVMEWLQKNYTLEENPGMGQEGLFYYYHTMAKALSAYGVDELILSNGKKINWRKDLALKLLNLQKADGMWINENGRWWERDPNLVTAYAVIVLDILHRGL
jgi:squalene-hopene/tetraprenyl-beta-curcumene cyclase